MTQQRSSDGGCQCGKIRYRLTGKPLMLYVCHCSDCQKQSGSAFGMSLIMARGQVEFFQGEELLRSWDTLGGNGRIKRCHYCPDCGTRIMHGSDDARQDVSIKAGSLDDTRGLKPSAHIWLQSAQPWVSVDRSSYACFDTEPDDRAVLISLQSRELAND